MYNEISKRCPNVKEILDKDSPNTIYYLLGKNIKVVGEEEMLCFWCIASDAFSLMYRKAVASRKGVG